MPRTAYKEGYNAFSPSYDPEEACPYLDNDYRYDDWHRGWDDALHDYCDVKEALGL